MVRPILLLLLLALAAGAEPLRTVRIGGIEWFTDYDAALKLARQQVKPLWLHFGENPG